MKKKNLLITALCLLTLLLASCASSPKGKITKCEPKSDQFTFLCGMVTVTCSGYPPYSGTLSQNGKYTKGIEITLLDLDADKEYKIKTEKDGFWYFPKAVPGHNYKIISVLAKKEGSEGSCWVSFPFLSRIFLCKNRQATVMTELRITGSGIDNSWRWEDSGNPEIVKNKFCQLYPGSAWANYDFAYYFGKQ